MFFPGLCLSACWKHWSLSSPEEFGYVLEGKIELQIEDEKFVLEPGDSFHIFSSQPHTIRNLSPSPAKILWVLTQKLLEGGIRTDGETSGH